MQAHCKRQKGRSVWKRAGNFVADLIPYFEGWRVHNIPTQPKVLTIPQTVRQIVLKEMCSDDKYNNKIPSCRSCVIPNTKTWNCEKIVSLALGDEL